VKGQRDLANRARSLFQKVLEGAPEGTGAGAVDHAEQEILTELIATAARADFDQRLDRALDMADDEQAAVEIAARAMHQVLPDHATEILLVGAKGVNLLQMAEAGPEDEGPGCPVIAAGDCPAMARAETMRFDNSNELDACPYLRDRIRGTCSAACVPMELLGRHSAIIHTVGDLDSAVDDTTLGYIQSIAQRTENKITLIRALQQATLVPTYDELTGLFDAAGTDAKMVEMTKSLIPFSIALCELDDFMSYQENYGTSIGDRAIRQFASSLRDVVRPTDIAGRYTGSEFLVVFPHTTTSEAASALERVRESIALSLAVAETPMFTASFGVAESVTADTLDDLLISASIALAIARENGKNRVVISGDEPLEIL